MAQDIVSSMFGLSPSEVDQQRQDQIDASALQYAKLDPFQRASMGMYQAGAGLGRIGAGMLGLQDPAVAEAQQRRAMLSGLDINSPESVIAHAQKVQDPKTKFQLMMLAQDLQDKATKRRLEEAHAKYYEQGGATGIAKPLSANQIEITRRQALTRGSQLGLSGQQLIDYADQEVRRAMQSTPSTSDVGITQVTPSTQVMNGLQVSQEQKDLMIADAESRGDTAAVETLKQLPVQVMLPSKAEAVAGVTRAREKAKMEPTIPPKALAAGIAEFRTTGKMPALGQGSAANRMAIIDGAAKEAETEGLASGEEALRKQGVVADRTANAQALSAITKDITAIEPYEKMLKINADIAKDLARKVVSSDVRLANRTLNWLRENAGDYPDTAEFLAQMEFVTTEAARVLNNPRLVGQLTVSAKKEMKDVISGDMPINSLVRVIDRIQSDGANRVSAMKDQQAKLRAALSGKTVEPTQAQPATTKPAVSLDAYLKSKGY